MKLTFNIGLKELFNLADQLPKKEKHRLIALLQKSIHQDKNQTNNGERQLGKYEGKIQMSDDFNDPIKDFKEYMR